MYFCSVVDGSGCASWVQFSGLSSIEDVNSLLLSSVFVLVVAFGFRMLRLLLFK